MSIIGAMALTATGWLRSSLYRTDVHITTVETEVHQLAVDQAMLSSQLADTKAAEAQLQGQVMANTRSVAQLEAKQEAVEDLLSTQQDWIEAHIYADRAIKILHGKPRKGR